MPNLQPEDQIGQELPPTEDPSQLSEWLTRTVININGALKAARSLIPTSVFPGVPYNGLLEYFQAPFTAPIYYEGPWMVVDGEWRPIIGMTYQAAYQAGKTYWPQDVVLDGPWTMTCLRKTLDRPAPQPSGPPETSLPDVPGFSTFSNVGVVHSGHRYIFNESGWLGGLRVWVPELTGTTSYRFVIIDITDPDAPVTSVIEEPVLKENDWTIIAMSNMIVQPGTDLIIYIDALNSGGSTPFGPFGWSRGPTDNNANPPTQSFNTNQQYTVLRIDKTDLDSFDRSAQLLGIIAGSTVTINLTSDPNSYVTFNINADPVDGGSSINFPIVLIADAAGDLPIGGPCTITADIPIQQSTEYVGIPNHWLANDPSWADIQGFLEFNGVPQGNPDNAYGIDISFTPASVSPDWFLVAYSVGIDSAAALAKGIVNNSTVATFEQMTATSVIDQNPAGIDIPLQITFGPAVGTVDDPVYMDASGTAFCTEDGFYETTLILAASRVGIPQYSYLVVYSSTNGVNASTSGLMTIDDPNDRPTFSFTTTHPLTAGDELKFWIVRDSMGHDSGGLHPHVPSTPGVNTVPSAWIRITKQELIA